MNKCRQCKKELPWGYQYSALCSDCDKKARRWLMFFGIGVILTIIGIVIGIRYLQAKFIYGDTKCIFAQCRITK